MAKYRFKPYEVEATQFHQDIPNEHVHFNDGVYWVHSIGKKLIVKEGDWIIDDPDSGALVVQDAWFKQYYELVEQPSSRPAEVQE